MTQHEITRIINILKKKKKVDFKPSSWHGTDVGILRIISN